MRDASDLIELVGDTLIEVLAIPGVPALLAAKATRGCAVRILVHDTGPQLVPLLNQPGIEIRLLEEPATYTIHRYDDELLLILHGRDQSSTAPGRRWRRRPQDRPRYDESS
jgi:hypothetical protein